MAKNSRAKGASGERELANILKGYGYTARRGQQYCGANGDADVVGLDGIHIECKRVERLNIDDAIEQAIADAKAGELPAVFHRKNRKPWLVTMTLDDWIVLYKVFKMLGKPLELDPVENYKLLLKERIEQHKDIASGDSKLDEAYRLAHDHILEILDNVKGA